MNLRQLEAFHEVILTGSVSEAARNMGRTQPAVSAMIAGLEDSLGCQLFERRGGRLHPVPESHYLFGETREILERLGRVRDTMREGRFTERDVLRVASMPAPSLFMLPALINRFLKEHEGSRAVLMTRATEQVLRWVATQQYDIGLVDLGVRGLRVDSSLVNLEEIPMECVCAVPAGDPLADKAEISPSDLDGRPMAALFEEHATFHDTAAGFAEAGAELDVRLNTQIFVPHFTFVEAGSLCAVVDPLSAASYRHYRGRDSRISFRPYRPAVPFGIGILTPVHKPQSRVSRAFLPALKKEILAFAEGWRDDAAP